MTQNRREQFGPEFLLIFVGYSGDGKAAAETICELEVELQRELDKLRRVNPRVPLNRIKFWMWDVDAASTVGGQSANINPAITRCNIAVFVFQERIGDVAWEELEMARKRKPRIPVLAFFPSQPPDSDKMMQVDVSNAWAGLLQKRKLLASSWTDPDTDALTPLPQFKDFKELRRISAERLVAEVVRLASDYAENSPGGDYKSDVSSSHNYVFLGNKKGGDAAFPQETNNLSFEKGHVLSIVPSNSAKYSASFITTLCAYNGPALVVDPTGSIYAATADQREKLGLVVKLDPWSLAPDARTGGLNPVDVVSALGMSDIDGAYFLADVMTPYSIYNKRVMERITSDPFWPNMQRKLLVGLILLALSEATEREAIFTRITQILNGDDVVYDFAKKLDADAEEKKMNPTAYRELASFIQQPENTRLGIIAGVNQHLNAFSSRVAQRASDSSTFDVKRWIKGEKITIYVLGPPPGVESFDTIYRLWLSVLTFGAAQKPKDRQTGTLIIVDINESFELWPGLTAAITHPLNCQIWATVSDLNDIEVAFRLTPLSVLNSFVFVQALRPKNFVAARRLADFFGIDVERIVNMGDDEIVVMVDGRDPQILRRLDS